MARKPIVERTLQYIAAACGRGVDIAEAAVGVGASERSVYTATAQLLEAKMIRVSGMADVVASTGAIVQRRLFTATGRPFDPSLIVTKPKVPPAAVERKAQAVREAAEQETLERIQSATASGGAFAAMAAWGDRDGRQD